MKEKPKFEPMTLEAFDMEAQPDQLKLQVVKNIIDSKGVDGTLITLIRNAMDIGKQLGFPNIFDRYKFKEWIIARCLGHEVFERGAGGGVEDKYGADAVDLNGVKCEYKSKIIDNEIQLRRWNLDSTAFSPQRYTISVDGVYNTADYMDRIEGFEEIDHYIAVFHLYDHMPIFIVKVDTDYVMESLVSTIKEWDEQGVEKRYCNKVMLKYDPREKEFTEGRGQIVWTREEGLIV